MFRDRVEPLLRAIVGTPPDRVMRQFRIVGMGESMVEETVGAQLAAIGLEVGYCARLGEVDLRLIGPHALVEEGSRFVRGAFRSAIFAEGLESLEGVVVALLRDRGATVTTAESCTGGAIISRLLSVPGASAVVEQASVVYSAAAKARVLGISPDIIETHTVYSEAVASAMAEHALRIAGADYALATTGVAGPGGGTASAPVGTVFVAIASRRSATTVRRCFFPTDREAFVHHVTQTGLAMLRTALLGEDVDL
jgi:nicotinamide-nucleotide amidase